MRNKALIILLFSILLVNSSVVFFRFPLVTLLYKLLVKGTDEQIYFITGIDRLVKELNPEGNLFVQFYGFDGRDVGSFASSGDTASIMFFRIAYCIYPKKVFVAPKGTKIVRGTEFLNSDFNPDDEWLAENNVGGILSFHRDETGQISWEYEKVLEKKGDAG
jgi:hypothetical protein